MSSFLTEIHFTYSHQSPLNSAYRRWQSVETAWTWQQIAKLFQIDSNPHFMKYLSRVQLFPEQLRNSCLDRLFHADTSAAVQLYTICSIDFRLLKFHGISFLVASSWHPCRHVRRRARILARMSRGSYEETASVEFQLYNAQRTLESESSSTTCCFTRSSGCNIKLM